MIITKKKLVIVKRSKLLCSHKFLRGEKTGKFCTELAMIGFVKCKTHFKKPRYQANLVAKLEKVMGDLLDVKLTKNEFGEWEDLETGFIFSYETQQIIGKRDSHKELKPLNIFDINLTLKRGWDIYVPETDAETGDV